ncbi:uncharacterized protein LOC133902188 [Phragmites australis]|uniref:uncharacterized protein LOC133902188 n=1 Tax=Phragmites australis TaxID=29695 RepID=UPI002D774385|nr:uncharacterized protein LOC133902188 [Phragmites australis]
MADHLLRIPPSYHLKLTAQHQSPTKTVLRIRRLLRAFVSKHAGRVAAAMGGARSLLLDLLSKKAGVELRRKTKRRRRNNMDPSCCGGSIAIHLSLLPPDVTLSSSLSSEMVVLEPLEAGLSYTYNDPSWSTAIPAELQPPPIAGYLEWPDEEDQLEQEDEEEDGDDCNEIDRLAESFIARCHERFMLEKQESYRRYQEMLARSL